MLDRIKSEPVMVVAVLLSLANVIFGVDATVVVEILETAALLVGGAIARSKVTPVRRETELNVQANQEAPNSDPLL